MVARRAGVIRGYELQGVSRSGYFAYQVGVRVVVTKAVWAVRLSPRERQTGADLVVHPRSLCRETASVVGGPGNERRGCDAE